MKTEQKFEHLNKHRKHLWEKRKKDVYFGFAHIPSANMEGMRFLTCTASGYQGAMKMVCILLGSGDVADHIRILSRMW